MKVERAQSPGVVENDTRAVAERDNGAGKARQDIR